MVEMYHENMGKVDQNNAKRQGEIAFHTHWPTKTWWHRVFSTIFGIMITDAYYMYQYTVKDQSDEESNLSFLRFCDILSCQMIHFKKHINGMNMANDRVIIPKMYQVFIFYLFFYNILI